MKLGRILAGLVGGAAFGILYAPKKGKELRKQILKKSSEDPTESLKALGAAFKEAGEEILGEVKTLSKNKHVDEVLKKSKAEMNKQMAKFEEKYPELTQIAKEKVDAITSAVAEKKAEAKKGAKKVVKKAKATKKKVVKKVKSATKKAKTVSKKVTKKAKKVTKTAVKKASSAKKKVSKAIKKAKKPEKKK